MSAIVHIEVNSKLYEVENDAWIEQMISYFNTIATLTPNQFEDIVAIVKEGIEYNLENALDFQGYPVLPLSPNTIKRKGHSRVFYDTGLLFKSVLSVMIGYDTAEVYIGGERSSVAVWLNQGTPNMVARPFFGIGPRMGTEIEKYFANIGYRKVA